MTAQNATDKKNVEKRLRVQINLTNKYKQRLHRMKPKSAVDTPRSKTRLLLNSGNREAVKKTVIFQHALILDIKRKYADTKNQRKKQTMLQLVTGRLLEKYKLKRKIAHAIGFSQKLWIQRQPGEGFIRRRKLSSGCKIVKDYFVRDDVSRMTTGKNNTITRRKCKRQRRLIVDSLKNLHSKFRAEFGNVVSYASFCRLRPF